ncbi:MAG: hypothetical protein JW963_13945 [Anaerolineales bacterium]|nr:hypothetical protein [Anaerolineales bacterium]
MGSDKNLDEKKIEFLIEAYKIRAQLYSDLTSRMWSRFNYLLTANAALFGLFFNFWIDSDVVDGIFWFPVVGIIISMVWFVLGAQDRYYFEAFRAQTREVESEISNELGVINLKGKEFGSAAVVKKDFLTWHWKFGSLSRLPALVPFLFVLIWILVFLIVLNTVGNI